jgi:hypothetical protein
MSNFGDSAAQKADETKGFGQQKAGDAQQATKVSDLSVTFLVACMDWFRVSSWHWELWVLEQDAAGATQGKAQQAQGAAGDKANQAKQASSDAAGAAQDKAGQAKDGAGNALQQAQQAAGDAFNKAKDAVTPNK